jgi:cobalt-zinc-cadmium efflux system protein
LLRSHPTSHSPTGGGRRPSAGHRPRRDRNVAASWLIARADRTSLNVEGAFQHILNDLFAFIATAIAGLVVILTGWVRADAVAALIVAGLMAKAGWGLIRDSWRIFLEAAPRGTDVAAIDADLHAVYGVLEVHDLHVWEVTSGFPALSAHILVDHSRDCHERRQTITALVHNRHGIDHTTLQVDHPSTTIVPTDQLRQRLIDPTAPHGPTEHPH